MQNYISDISSKIFYQQNSILPSKAIFIFRVSEKNMKFQRNELIDVSSPEHPYGLVVNDVARSVINSFEGGDKEQILDDVRLRLDSFSSM